MQTALGSGNSPHCLLGGMGKGRESPALAVTPTPMAHCLH